MSHIHALSLTMWSSSSKPLVPSCFSTTPTRRGFVKLGPLSQQKQKQHNLKRLTARIVQLTRRRQLHQIFEEVEVAKSKYGELNTIVMNAVLEACVHCGDIDAATKLFDEMLRSDSCAVDSVTYGTLLKGLGEARRIDEAFQMLESLELGTAVGTPKLSAPLIFGLLNALIESGNLRRASGLLARYGFLLREDGRPSVLIYNVLMKGYVRIGCPEAALDLNNEVRRGGLQPDRLTYNTLILACIKMEKLDVAIQFFEEMKDKAQKNCDDNLCPDLITYTTLLKGFGNAKDLYSVQATVFEMKMHENLQIDRTAFTAIVDGLLNCGSKKDALCIFGEIIKLAGMNSDFRPKPHLYLSMMRYFAAEGDHKMVKNLHKRMWPESAGNISPAFQEEADHLLMEANLNDGQVDEAICNLKDIIQKWKGILWSSRGGMVALRIEALLGLMQSIFCPYLLPQILPGNPVHSIMTPLEAARPLRGTVPLKKVVMRFYREPVVPIIDEWGSCIGLLHREDCIELNAPLMKMMRSPPPCVTTTTSIGHVINQVLDKRYKMVVVVKHSTLHDSTYSSSLRAVGVFTAEQLFKLLVPATDSDVLGDLGHGHIFWRRNNA